MRSIVEGYPKNAKNAVLDLTPPTLQNFIIFHDSTRPICLHCDVCRRNRGDPFSI